MGHGMDGLDAFQPHAGLFLVQLAALKVGLLGSVLLIGGDGVPVLNEGLPFLEQRVLGRDDHISHTEQRVAPGGVDRHLVAHVAVLKVTSAPVERPIQLRCWVLTRSMKSTSSRSSIRRSAYLVMAQHPLALFLADDLAAAALADTLHDLLVCQHALAARAPVDGHGCLIGQVILEQLEEDPLGPLVVVGVRGVHHPVPVEGIAQHVKLLGEVGDVLLGDDGGMDVVLDGVVLRRQAKGIKADGDQHVVTLHPLLAADDVHFLVCEISFPILTVRDAYVTTLFSPEVAPRRSVPFGRRR